MIGCFPDGSFQKLIRANQALKTYNAIIRGIRRTNPAATQCYLTYHDTNELPRQVRPESGLFPKYAPMDRDFDKGLADESSERNCRENRHLSELLSFFGTEGARVLDY